MDPTTLMTFLFKAPPEVRIVELLGSWDNFQRPYRMHHDVRRGRDVFSGCFKFEGIVYDGTGLQWTKPRTGGLRQGGTYWYYYRLNFDVEAFDDNRPHTTCCPLIPGQAVNVVDVPVEILELPHRCHSACGDILGTLGSLKKWRTLDPASKFADLSPPPISKVHHNYASDDALSGRLENVVKKPKKDVVSPASAIQSVQDGETTEDYDERETISRSLSQAHYDLDSEHLILNVRNGEQDTDYDSADYSDDLDSLPDFPLPQHAGSSPVQSFYPTTSTPSRSGSESDRSTSEKHGFHGSTAIASTTAERSYGPPVAYSYQSEDCDYPTGLVAQTRSLTRVEEDLTQHAQLYSWDPRTSDIGDRHGRPRSARRVDNVDSVLANTPTTPTILWSKDGPYDLSKKHGNYTSTSLASSIVAPSLHEEQMLHRLSDAFPEHAMQVRSEGAQVLGQIAEQLISLRESLDTEANLNPDRVSGHSDHEEFATPSSPINVTYPLVQTMSDISTPRTAMIACSPWIHKSVSVDKDIFSELGYLGDSIA